MPELAEVSAFTQAIEKRFGHQPDASRVGDLRNLLAARMLKHGSRSYEEYRRKLEDGAEEWEALAPLLTVPETYFFRMPAHFDALALEALPNVLAANAKTRTLRILSAGCASGEEPYTLRMVLKERFPQLADWTVQIVGVDLSEAALARARAGVYSEWSLRATSAPRRRANFESFGRQYRLLPESRLGVEFRQENLLEPPPSEPPFDIIFCRNVLIYFSEPAMRQVIDRLTERLAVGGYLFLGPAESLRGISRDYDLCHRHDSFFYKRRGERPKPLATGPVSLRMEPQPLAEIARPVEDASWFETIRNSSERLSALVATGPAEKDPSAKDSSAARKRQVQRETRVPSGPAGTLESRVATLVQQEKFLEAMALLDAAPPLPNQTSSHLLRALLLTNLGRYQEAVRECGLLLAESELDAGGYYLLSLCREQQGQLDEAQIHMARAVYLQPGFAMAQLHRGLIARRQGQMEAARAAFEAALHAIETEDAERLALFGGGFSREGLRSVCRRELARLEVA